MIFFVANDGTVINSYPSPVYQGSANANNIYLVAPFAENLVATVAFKLPNGVYTERYPMTPTGEIAGLINEATGKPYSGWQFSMPNEITQYFGTVTAQFYFYAAERGKVLASSYTSFTVGKGVPEIDPNPPSDSVYDMILSYLAGLQQQLNNGTYAARAIYAYNPAYKYGANEITYTDGNGEYGAFVRSKVANNTQPPFNALGELNTNWEIVADFDEIYQWVRYGVAVSNATLIFSPLDPNVSVQNETLIFKGEL